MLVFHPNSCERPIKLISIDRALWAQYTLDLFQTFKILSWMTILVITMRDHTTVMFVMLMIVKVVKQRHQFERD